MRQEVTRAHKGWALDTVTLHNEVLKQIKEEITSAPPVRTHSPYPHQHTSANLFRSSPRCPIHILPLELTISPLTKKVVVSCVARTQCSNSLLVSSPQEGVYVYGLFLDGAGWDRRNCRLIEATPKVLFTALPVVHMFAINSTAPKDPKLYICPIYKKPRRTDLTYITGIVMRTTQIPEHWMLRGVALLCDIK